MGTYPITATAGTLSAANYSFTFAAGTLTITQASTGIVCSPVAITYGTPLSSTQLNCTSGGVTGNFVLTPAVGTVLPAGVQSISVAFTPTDTTDYETATASVSLSVNKATPVITWPTPVAITYGTALSATQLDARSRFQARSLIHQRPGGFDRGCAHVVRYVRANRHDRLHDSYS